MAKLASISDAAAAIARDLSPDLSRMMDQALETATHALSAYLRQPFTYQSSHAFFRLNGWGVLEYGGDKVVFELPQGFIDRSQSISILFSNHLDELKQNRGAVVITDQILIDDERGYIEVHRYPFYDYARIDYSAGFREDADEVGKRYIGVPHALKSAALQYGLAIYNANREINNKKKMAIPPAKMPQAAEIAIAKYRRNRQDCVRALRGI